MNPKYNVWTFVFITYFIFQCLCLKINALLRYFYCVFSFSGVYLKGSVCLFLLWLAAQEAPSCIVSLASCVVSRISHCLCSHSMASAASTPPFPVDHSEHCGAPPRGACAWVQHPVQGWRVDRPAASLHYFGCFPPLGFPVTDTAMSTCCYPPHVFWTGWGPWERCTAQCGGGIQARRRTCGNGPDCAGCNVVSSPHPSPRSRAGRPGDPQTPGCSAHTECYTHKRCSATQMLCRD